MASMKNVINSFEQEITEKYVRKNITYDNKREFTGNKKREFTGNKKRAFTGNKKRENVYIYENICGLSHTKTANKNSNYVVENLHAL